jgi:hypothetical protein
LPGDLNRKFEHAPHCSFITTTEYIKVLKKVTGICLLDFFTCWQKCVTVEGKYFEDVM